MWTSSEAKIYCSSKLRFQGRHLYPSGEIPGMDTDADTDTAVPKGFATKVYTYTCTYIDIIFVSVQHCHIYIYGHNSGDTCVLRRRGQRAPGVTIPSTVQCQ